MKLFQDLVAKMPQADKWLSDDFRASYMVFDLETTGFVPGTNFITQLGCLLVRDGMLPPVDSAKSQYIKTPYSSIAWSAVHAGRDERTMQFLTLLRKAGQAQGLDVAEYMDACKKAIDANDGSIRGLDCIPQDIQEMRGKNGNYLFIAPVDVTNIRSTDCEKFGSDRAEAVGKFAMAINKVMSLGWPILGHNIVRLDIPFLEYEAEKIGGVKLEINPEMVIDTGMLVKGDQCGSKIGKSETIVDFYRKIENKRSRVKWSLDDYCVPRYQLDTTYGVDVTKQHGNAGYDCWVNNCLVRELIK